MEDKPPQDPRIQRFPKMTPSAIPSIARTKTAKAANKTFMMYNLPQRHSIELTTGLLPICLQESGKSVGHPFFETLIRSQN